MNSLIRVCRFFSLLLLPSLAWALEEIPSNLPVPMEPVEFIDVARPNPNDPANRRMAPTVPIGWGFALFSPDSQSVMMVSVADGAESKGEVLVWSVADLKPGSRFESPQRIAVVGISPEGKRLAIGPHGPQSGLPIIDLNTGQMAQTLPGPVARTNLVVWSPDGKQLVLGSSTDKTIRVWNVAEKKFIKAYEPDAARLLAIGFAKSGLLLAAGVPAKDRDGFVIYDVVAGQVLKTLKGHKELIETATFSGDASRLASAGWDASIRVWDVETAKEMAIIKGHKKGIRSLSMSASGNRLISSSERELKLWNGEKQELQGDLGDENAGAKFVAMSPDGAWAVSIARDGTARLWDVEKTLLKGTLDRNPIAMTASQAAATPPAVAGPASPAAGETPEPEAIQSLAYSRDGKWIALAREDGRISIRHAADGKVARELDGFLDVASCVIFSHDSQRIAAGSFDKTIRVWNVTTGELLAELKGHTNWVFSVAFSPDGLTLASGGYDKAVKLWNLAAAKETTTLMGHTAGVRSVAFAQGGTQVISGSADRTAIVWNLMDAQPLAKLKGHTAAVRAIAISPDGVTVATASEDATIKLWQTADWTERISIAGPEGVMFWCLAFSPAGRTLAAGAFDGTVKLYDPSDGRERQSLRGPTEAITAVAFAPDTHEIVAGSVDKSLRRWKAAGVATSAAVTGTAPGAASTERPVSPNPDKPAELNAAEAITALQGRTLPIEEPVSSLTFNQEGTRLIVGGGAYRAAGSLQLWNVTDLQVIWKSRTFRFGIPAVAFSSDEKQIAMGTFADHFLRFFAVDTGGQSKEVRGHRGKIHAIASSPDGKRFATAALDREIKLWDAATNKEIKTLVGHTDFVFSIAFSSDGKRLLSGSADRTARLWDLNSGLEVIQLTGHQGGVQQAVFAKDESLIACASSDGTARIYEGNTGNFLLTLRGHQNKLECIAFSPNGQLIVTGSSDKTIRFWNPQSGTELLKLTQMGIVRAVGFTPDGKYLASGGDDKKVTLWDATRIEHMALVEPGH